MSTTSSEEKADGYESARRGSETAEEGEEDADGIVEEDERDRKRRRTSSSKQARELEREVRMERYAKARIREIDAAKKHASGESASRTQKGRARDPSRSRSVRSDDRSRSKSPAMSHVPPARVGKRLRRRPQRWEGSADRKEQRATRTVSGASSRAREVDLASRESDGEQTVSANSMQFEPEAPAVDNPVSEMRKAATRCGSELSRRTIVDSFHTWQLQAVSRQAAQQKALHVYLKRKLRKRAARTPELERLEEEALRSARTATVISKSGDNDEDDDEDNEIEKADEEDHANLVPARLRLPLEAYLPRRVSASKVPVAPEDIFKLVPPEPHLPGVAGDKTKNDGQEWMRLPTVSTSSLLNKQKNGSKQKTARAMHAM